MHLLSISTSYRYYQKQGGTLTEEEYKKLIRSYLKNISDKILRGIEILLPGRMGSMKITGRKVKPKFDNGKVKGLAPDWKATKDLWNRCSECKENKQLVYHLNEHSDGYRYKFYWEKTKALISERNQPMYSFVPTRTNKRRLCELIKSGKEYLLETRKYE